MAGKKLRSKKNKNGGKKSKKLKKKIAGKISDDWKN